MRLHVLYLTLSLVAFPAGANVYGDGEPENGPEDGRLTLPGRTSDDIATIGRTVGAGTIHCEERTRGSAMLLDVSELVPNARGTYLVTAAHVLWNLKENIPFTQCEFRYQGLSAIPGFQAPLSTAQMRTGEFDPGAEIHSARFGREDWALIRLAGEYPDWTGSAQPLPWSDGQSHDAQYLLLAFDDIRERMSISPGCQVVESRVEDLGGGHWPGQLLDDCDSGPGASGGALLADLGGQRYLVGIRTGSHWSAGAYPESRFPEGPPDGARWDVRSNTNFARAIDHEIIAALRALASTSRPTTVHRVTPTVDPLRKKK